MLLLLLITPWNAALAVGTLAGTPIDNQATLEYTQNGTRTSVSANAPTIRVNEVISVRVTAPAAPAIALSPEANKVLAFTVTNVGNGREAFNLTVNLSPAVADQFNPQPGSAGQLFIDSNGNGVLDVGVDTPVSGPVTVNADQSVRVLVVANIPAGLANGDQGVVALTATSATPGAAGAPPGTVLPGSGTPVSGGAPVDAIVLAGPGGAGDSGADDAANGVFLVSGVSVSVAKTVFAVTSAVGVTTAGCDAPGAPAACLQLVPGVTLHYRVTLTVSGAGVAQSVLFSDRIPANTTWVAGSMRVNNAARTDAADGDNATCTACGNATGVMAVNFGDVTVTAANPVVHIIEYRLVIN